MHWSQDRPPASAEVQALIEQAWTARRSPAAGIPTMNAPDASSLPPRCLLASGGSRLSDDSNTPRSAGGARPCRDFASRGREAVVADDAAVEAHQDRGESHPACPVRGLPDGGGCCPARPIPGDPGADPAAEVAGSGAEMTATGVENVADSSGCRRRSVPKCFGDRARVRKSLDPLQPKAPWPISASQKTLSNPENGLQSCTDGPRRSQAGIDVENSSSYGKSRISVGIRGSSSSPAKH